MTGERIMRRRWSGDKRGSGIADGRSALPLIDAVCAEMAAVGWLTEDGHDHLAEPLGRAASGIGVEVRTRTSAAGVLIAEATVFARERRELRTIAYRGLAEIAEAQTVVRERHGTGRSTYLIATGQPDGPRLAGHGHIIELRLHGSIE